MAFNLNRKGTFKSDVQIPVPVEDGTVTETIKVEFKRLGTDELKKAQRGGDVQLLRHVVAGWDGVTNDGAAVPFTPENLEAFLQVPYAVRATALAYAQDIHGIREKN